MRMTDSRGLLYPVQDLLVLDPQLGIVLGLRADDLAEGVVLARVGRDIGQDGQLVDVRVVFRVYVLEFGMKGRVAGAGQAGVAFVDLGEGIAYVEVGVIVVSRQPAGGGVGNLVGLWFEFFALGTA
jgi:hypothetical protein